MGNSNYIVHFCSYKEIEDLLLRHSFEHNGDDSMESHVCEA